MKKNDHLSEEQISVCAEAMADGLYSGLDESVKEHLAECMQCGNEVLMVSEIYRQGEQNIIPENIPFLSRRRLFFLISSAAALLLIALLIYFPLQKTGLNNELTISSADSVKDRFDQETTDTFIKLTEYQTMDAENKPVDSKLSDKSLQVNENKNNQLALYETHAVLENLFNNFENSYRSVSFKYVGERTLEVPPAIKIIWQNPGNEILTVDIFNNRNDKLFSLNSAGNHVVIPDLAPGLYYFKIINEEFDLLSVGKILSR